ncbi:MAG: carboxypeptidase regulatory-like domain-containing protein [Bryobacteraceae bacterium]
MLKLLTLAVVTVIVAGPVFSQSAGTIQGVVSDNTGAVIPGARVAVTNVETGAQSKATANAVGFYTVPALNPGIYTVACESEGLAPSEHPNLRLEVAQTMRVDFRLNLGTVTEVVEVSAAAVLLQSEKTDVGQVIDSKRILEMPLNGRNYLQLAQFAVGVLPSRDLGKGTRHDGEQGGEGGFRAMGMHAAQNNILLDGNDNSSRNSGGPLGFQSQAVKPPVDAVAEFKVVTNNTSAEYGYRTGAKVIVSTKSGTNEFHGSLYEFLRNDALDGTNFFANRSGAKKPSFRQNQYGATFGGPLIKNKMFAFASWQGTRIRLGRSFISSVPSRDAINGDFSRQPAPDRDIFDPLTYDSRTGARLPFVGNVIPAARMDPVARRVADLYPAPNIAGREHARNNFFFSPVQKNDFDQYDFRWDYNVSDAHRWFIRYSVRNQNEDQPGTLPYPATGGTGQTIKLDGDNVASSFTSTIGATMFNELRFGFSHFPTRFDIPYTENLNKELGILNAPGDAFGDDLDHGMTLFAPAGFELLGPRGFWPNQNNLDNLLIADSFSIVKGRHTVKFGGEYRRSELFRESSRHRRGRFDFSGVFTTQSPDVAASRGATGAGLADMLLGWASNANWGHKQGENHFVNYWSWFVQDDWKITPRLTLNAGLRWELFGPPTFDNPDGQTVGRFLTEVNGRPFAQGEANWGAEEFLSTIVFPKDNRDCGCNLDMNNFAPRLGLAYRITNRTVIRAGGGIYYGEADNTQSEAARFFAGPPRAIELTAPQPRTRSTLFVKDGLPAIPAGAWPSGTNINTTYDNLPTFYASQWFFDIQREHPARAAVRYAPHAGI